LSFKRAFQEKIERGEGLEGEKELIKWWADLVEKEPEVEGGPKKNNRRIEGNNDFKNLRDSGQKLVADSATWILNL